MHAPLIDLTKADIIRLRDLAGRRLRADAQPTPAAEGRACGRCDSCQIRRAGFVAAEMPDPTRYA
ncbi:MAG: 7-cyano-7-deazaguanine synthase [Gemmataceae bacterium]